MPVVPLRVRARVTIPGDIVRHLAELRRDDAGHVVVLDLRAPDGGLASQARLVGVVGIAHHGRREGETEERLNRRIQRLHEIERQQHLALDRRAVEGRPRAKRCGRRCLGRATLALTFTHERDEIRGGSAEPRGPQPMRPQLRPRGECSVGIDLEPDGRVAGDIGLDQRRTDAREGIKHDTRRFEITGQRVLNEVPGKARDPGHPPVHRRFPIGHESGIAEAATPGDSALSNYRGIVVSAFTSCANAVFELKLCLARMLWHVTP